MFNKIGCIVALMLLLWAATACSPAFAIAELAPTPPPLDLPTLIPPTPTAIPTATVAPTATASPTVPLPTATAFPTLPLPTATMTPVLEIAAATSPTPVAASPTLAITSPTPVSPPTATSSPTVASSPTAINSPTPQATPTPAGPVGVFVTGLRTQPNPPVRGPDLKFYVTFANSTGREQNFQWLVYIYRADTPSKTFGETSRSGISIPPGTIEPLSLGSWKLPLGGPCDYFFARVVAFNDENKAVPFTTPDGKVFEKGLTICP